MAEEFKAIVFKLADESYGIEVDKVRTIERMSPVTRVPKTPPFVKGVINLRGNVVPVIDLRGRFAFSITHPTRWMFPDDPGEEGLVASQSYWDRTPYVEVDDVTGQTRYVEHHRTAGDRVRELVGAGLVLDDLVEPEWPEGHDREWGQWSPMRGRLIPGTSIWVAHRPR